MAFDPNDLAPAGVKALHPYQPGQPIDELARELGLDPGDIVKLASNENPLGPSPKALAAIRAELDELCRYPDGNGHDLKQALAARLQVEPAQITLGNGSNDVLELVVRGFVGADSEVIYSQYAFAVYPIATLAAGAKGVEVPAANWGHDLEAMAAAVTRRTRIIFIANPNNPTGTSVELKDIERFMTQVPDNVLVVLDEAYIEYLGNGFESLPGGGLSLLGQFPNLIVTRTFSKAWGLAALRIGYAVSTPAVADILNRVRQPFNVDSPALAAATAVLDDEDYLVRSQVLNRQGLSQLEESITALGLSFIPSSGNFLAVEVGPEAGAIYSQLLAKGVIVRPVGAYGMTHHLRVSVGLARENERFLTALSEVLNAQ